MTGSSVHGIEISIDELMAVREEALGLTWQDLIAPEARQLSQGQQLTEARGMEYRESRAYVVGDDYRSIDWRAMARSGEAYTKIFSDQREQTATIAIDLSASLFFGTTYSFKSWTVARLAAFIAWLCERSQLAIECFIAGPQAQIRIPSGPGRRNLPKLFSTLSQQCHYSGCSSNQHSLLDPLLARCQENVHRGTLFFLLSDCLAANQRSNRLLSDISRGNKTIVCRVHDQTETGLWPAGNYATRIGNDEVNYRHQAGDRVTALQEVQTAVDNRVCRFGSIASRQLRFSCNRDLGEQLREKLVGNHDP